MTCLVDGCERPVRVKIRGLCAAHYARWQTGVPLDKPLRKRARGYVCEFPGCDQPRKANGWCAAHLAQSASGLPMKPRRGMERTLAERFWPRVDKSGECWTWTGAKDQHGYGSLTFKRVRFKAHRVALELSGVTLVPGLVVDHLCRNPSCVRPDHLEQVTQKVNTIRGTAGETARARGAAQTHCKRGHPFTPENTYVNKTSGARVCRTCQRGWQKDHQARRRAADQ